MGKLDRVRILLCCLSAWVLGCTSDPVRLEIGTWWSSGSEERAFNVLDRAHRNAHPAVSIDAPPDTNVDIQRQVQQKTIHGVPPDTFHTNIGMGLLKWTDRRGIEGQPWLRSVLGLVGERLFHPDLLRHLTFAGQVYAVPVNIHRTNVLYYNPKLRAGKPFAFNEICSEEPPPTEKPKLVILDDGWYIHSLVLENILPAVENGADLYSKLFCLDDRCAATTFGELKERLSEALRCVQQLSTRVEICVVQTSNNTCGVQTTSEGPAWVDQLEAVVTGKAHFTVIGDWANGELANETRNVFKDEDEDEDIAAQQFPTKGGEKLFVYTSDVFPLPARAPHPLDAEDLLRTLLSPEVQRDFSEAKGSIPALRDAPLGTNALDVLQHMDKFNAPGMQRLVATSGLLPPEYPHELAHKLFQLMMQEGDPQKNFDDALAYLEVGFSQVKSWTLRLRCSR